MSILNVNQINSVTGVNTVTFQSDSVFNGTTTFNSNIVGGNVTLPTQERFLIYKTGDQTGTDTQSLTVSFPDTADYDTLGGWDGPSARYVVQKSGFFLLVANILIRGSSGNTLRECGASIEKSTDSGSTWTVIAVTGFRASTTSNIDSDTQTSHITFMDNLNAGDYLRVGAFANTNDAGTYLIETNINDAFGSNIINTGAAADYNDKTTYFSGVKIG